MNAQLSEILELLESAGSKVDRLVASVTEERWHSRPEPGAWSAAQCLEHLNMTSEAYREPLRRAMEEARALAGGVRFEGRHRCDPLGWIMASVVGPAPRVRGKRRGRVKAPAPFLPADDPPRDEVVGGFRRHQAWLSEIVRECDGLPLRRVKVASVFVPSVRYNLYATLLVVARHQHRHLQQAREAADLS